MTSVKHSKIDIENKGKVLNLRWQRNRKIFVTSEMSSGLIASGYPSKTGDLYPVKHEEWWVLGVGPLPTSPPINHPPDRHGKSGDCAT